MAECITLMTSSPSGDAISFLAGMKQLWVNTGKKCILYHRLNLIGGSYEGAEQPYGNEQGLPVCFNQYCFDMMKPLMLSQEYVKEYLVFNGQEHEISLDKIRLEGYTNQPRASLNRWFNYIFPEMASDLSQIWINVPKAKGYEDKILINYTQRKRNTFIHYFFLKQHQHQILFAGLQKERDAFCAEFGLDIPLLKVSDFYELATIINGCKFIMGNESFCFQLAESLKVPRILELFPMMPTTIPIGENAFDFYHQGACEYYFNKLLNK